MEIIEHLPRDVARKVKFYFKSPIASMIEEYWKEPVLLRKKWVIAQLNRFNWLTYSQHYHNYGDDLLIRRWVEDKDGLFRGNRGLLFWKLKVHDVLDPLGLSNILSILVPNSGKRKKVLKKIWACPLKKDRDTEWKKRSLFGGNYPLNRRPRVHPPRNPFTKRWNLRWNSAGELWKLCAKEWKRNPWRICQWETRGAIITKLDGSSSIYMRGCHEYFIPVQSSDLISFV